MSESGVIRKFVALPYGVISKAQAKGIVEHFMQSENLPDMDGLLGFGREMDQPAGADTKS